MSVQVLSRVFEQSKSSMATRIVLIVLADAAHNDGITWIKLSEIAERANVSRMTVIRAIDNLEALGEVVVRKAQRGKRRINVYRITLPGVLDPDYDRMPDEIVVALTGSHPDDDEVTSDAFTGSHPDTSSYIEENVSRTVRGTVSAPGSVDRKLVSDQERESALLLLAIFNGVFGTSFVSKTYVAKIILRMREHPEITVEQHEQIIRAAYADPWWRSDPDPRVIYGNSSVFDRAREKGIGNGGPAFGSLSLAELASYGDKWGPGTEFETIAEARASGAV